MENLDQIRVHFSPNQLVWLNICLAFLMFGISFDVKLNDFKDVFKTPKVPFVGLFAQFFLFPLLTLGLIYVFQPPLSVAMGMTLVAACPSGNIANYATHLAKANVALSVTLNSIITLAATFSTPLGFAFWSRLVPGHETFSKAIYIQPTDMVGVILQLIVLPIAAGILLSYYYPTVIDVIRKPVRVVSFLIFLGFIVGALASNWSNIVQYLGKIFLLVFIHNSIALLMGYFFAKANKLSIRDCRTLSIEAGIHNTGLGLILIFNFFDGVGGMAVVAAWWGIWDMIVIFFLAMLWSRKEV